MHDAETYVLLFRQPSTYEEPSGAAGSNQNNADDSKDAEQTEGAAVSKDEVLTFQVNCSNCNSPTESRMKVVGILYIVEV